MVKRNTFLLFAAVALGQTPEPHFDVAAIHPSMPNREMRIEVGRGQVTLVSLPMHMIIREAGAPDASDIVAGSYARWMLNQYDIQAKAGPATKPGELRLMLQSLLRDRFQMRWHIEQRTKPGVVMVAGRSGLLVKPVASGDPVEAPRFVGKEFRAENATLDEIAAAIGARIYKSIDNKSGIEGRFTFSVTFPTDVSLGGTPIHGDGEILDPISKALGLRFSEGNVNARAIVIDHLEAPNEN